MNENGDLFGLRDRIGDCNMALESSFYQLSNAVLQSPIRPRRPKQSTVFDRGGEVNQAILAWSFYSIG